MGEGGQDGRTDDIAVLVESAANGDKAAWTTLVTRFSGLVWSVARGHGLGSADAEEVFQTTWLLLTEHLGRIKEPGRVGAWLAATARHEAIRLLRVRARTTLTTDFDVLDQARDASPEQALLDLEEHAVQARRLREVWLAFGRLPGQCQRLLRLLIASPPLSYAEVAATLGIAVGSIGPTRARCLQRLRLSLAGSGIAGGAADG
jgi:RNA polymerase sigma factor (sigma-70 family)